MLSLREGIADGIDTISRHYANFAPTNDRQLTALIDDYAREVSWADGDTVLAGFRLALHGAGKFAPRFGEIVASIKHADKIRTGTANLAPVVSESVICVACGTETLVEVPHPTQHGMPARLYPAHRPGCRVAAPHAA